MAQSLVPVVMEVEVIRLESSLTREVWWYAGLPSSFSVFAIPAWCLYALCPPPERGISSASLTAYLGSGFVSLLHLYVAGCPAYCSLLYLSCPLATFSWLNASCVQLYVYLFLLLVVTLLRHIYKMLTHCVWLCYHNGRKYMLLLVTIFSTLTLDSRQANVSFTLSSALAVSRCHKSLLWLQRA